MRGDQWPIFIYAGYRYDPEDPWNGLLRSSLLVCVSSSTILRIGDVDAFVGLQTYLHIAQFG